MKTGGIVHPSVPLATVEFGSDQNVAVRAFFTPRKRDGPKTGARW